MAGQEDSRFHGVLSAAKQVERVPILQTWSFWMLLLESVLNTTARIEANGTGSLNVHIMLSEHARPSSCPRAKPLNLGVNGRIDLRDPKRISASRKLQPNVSLRPTAWN